MGEKTTISWADKTFNPWIGCIEVSEGCTNCYARTLADRFYPDHWGPAKTTPRLLMSDNYWRQLLIWNEKSYGKPIKPRVFVGSMCDVFESHPLVTNARHSLFRYINSLYNLTFLLLTKRPGNILKMIPKAWAKWQVPSNVWIGTSVENQEMAEKRIPLLVNVTGKHYLSVEPMLGPVNFQPFLIALNWVIIGGESGAGARPMSHQWAIDLVHQCQDAKVPVFVKQLGGVRHKHDDPDEQIIDGRYLWPQELRIQQFPE